jgi:nucleoside-diphosphate-sugar epimerase
VIHLAAQYLAFTSTTCAIATTMGNCQAGIEGSLQHRFVGVGCAGVAAGLDGNPERHAIIVRVRNLLIVGCGDVVRRALPRLLHRYRVLALVRQRDPALQALGVVQIVGDLDQPQTLRRLAGLAQHVLHSAPPPEIGTKDPRTQHLLDVLRRGKILPCRLVYISTSGIYGDCQGARIDETRAPQPLTERGMRRLDAERRLRQFGRHSPCRVSILRAPGIYADERLPTERLRRGWPVLRTDDDVYTNHIHADDLADLCIAALAHGKPNRACHASDDSDMRMGDWYDLLADSFDLPRPPRVSRAEAESRLPAATLSFMRESRRLDNKRMKRELRFQLRYPTLHAGLASLLGRRHQHAHETPTPATLK